MAHYERCLELASRSKSEVMKFGSILIKEGRVIGEGWNRSLAFTEKPPFPVCPWSIHSEQDAIWNAIRNGKIPNEARLYCLGFFTDTKLIYAPAYPLWTCTRCWKLMRQLGITPMRFNVLKRIWERVRIYRPETRYKSVSAYRARINVNRTWRFETQT